MICIYGIKINDLPPADVLEAAIDQPLLRVWLDHHGSLKHASRRLAGLGGLWLLQQAGYFGELLYTPGGRPCAVNCAWDFNVTHTDGWVFCAVERLEAPLDRAPRVGLDAEELGRFEASRRAALVERWCTDGEVAEYKATPTDECFTRLWTRKEAYVKYSGEGLCAIRRTDVTAGDSLRFADYQIGDTVLTLCCHKDAEIPTDVTVLQFS